MSIITVNQLVLDAFYLTDQYDYTRMPTEGDMSRAMGLLSYIIQASPSVDIPFQSAFTWNLIPGQGSYTFGPTGQEFTMNRIQRLSFCFLSYLNTTYPITVIEPYEFYQSTRVLNVESRPQTAMLENAQGVSTITVYPQPDQNYEITIKYTMDLSDFTPFTQINNIPTYYLNFMRYALAKEISHVYNLTWSPSKELNYVRLYNNMMAANFHDMTVRTSDVRRVGPAYWRIISGF